MLLAPVTPKANAVIYLDAATWKGSRGPQPPGEMKREGFWHLEIDFA